MSFTFWCSDIAILAGEHAFVKDIQPYIDFYKKLGPRPGKSSDRYAKYEVPKSEITCINDIKVILAKSLESLKETVEDPEEIENIYNHIKKCCYTEWGNICERRTIQILKKQYPTLQHDMELVTRKVLTINGIDIYISGKVDAYIPETDTILEIKSRIGNKVIYKHDKIQLMSYKMLLGGTSNVEFIAS